MIPGWGVAEESRWLIDNPAFDERPASMQEFLGEGYMEIDKYVRPGLRTILVDIFGDVPSGKNPSRYGKAIFSGAIGIGKSTFAAIALSYLCHWTMCLRDPQEFFNLMPGSRISFMMMSTSSNNARGVIFDDVKGRINNSPWFKENYPYDDKWEREIRFPQKNVFILPGGSKETQFEGYNILGGILDEMDSHKAPRGGMDYADQGYDTIINRIQSRYGDRGLIMPIGQMKKSGGFAARKYAELKNDPDAYTASLSIWESFGMDYEKYQGEDGKPDTFYFDKMRNLILPDDYFSAYGAQPGGNILVIPKLYLSAFKTNPIKALRDLAGIPPASESPFISMTDRIMSCRERWVEDELGNPADMDSVQPPVSDAPDRPIIDPGVIALDSIPRVVHIDQAFSGAQESDAAGIAMGHISRMVDQDGELKPYIHLDLLMRVKAKPGSEIMLQDLREVLYTLRDERGFKISRVTFDSFQSQSSVQILRKRRFKTDILSVDKEKAPYEDLRDAIHEERLGFPPYMTYLNVGDTERVEIAVKELSELTDTGMKIDHPASGSKDLADAMAAVVYTLIGDKKYRRSVASRKTNNEPGPPRRTQTPEGILSGNFGGPGRGPATRPAQVPTGMIPDPTSIQIPPHLRA